MRKFLDTSRIRRESRESRFNREIRRKSIFFRKDGIWENFDSKDFAGKSIDQRQLQEEESYREYGNLWKRRENHENLKNQTREVEKWNAKIEKSYLRGVRIFKWAIARLDALVLQSSVFEEKLIKDDRKVNILWMPLNTILQASSFGNVLCPDPRNSRNPSYRSFSAGKRIRRLRVSWIRTLVS